MGEFCVTAYGDVSVAELFEASKKRTPIETGFASIADKSGFIEVPLPHGARLDIALRSIRRGDTDSAFSEYHTVYKDPDAPAIAVVVGYRGRLRAFRDATIPTPPAMVVFIGTSRIEDF